MRITTAKELFNVISDYFSSQTLSATDLLLILPGLLFLLGLLLYTSPEKSDKDLFAEIPKNEMETIKQIAAQKGLSSFDRDFLIIQALRIYAKPLSILLDPKTFNRLQLVIEDKAIKSGKPLEEDENLKTIKRIKSKLFN